MLILEGIDGVGKTTVVDCLEKLGMKKYHFDYDEKNTDLVSKYLRVINQDTKNIVLDRSFISEMVYGPVIRSHCKLSIEEYKQLLKAYKKIGAKIIYLTAPKEILIERRKDDSTDSKILEKYYDELKQQYDKIMALTNKYIEVLKYDTFINTEEEIERKIRGIVIE